MSSLNTANATASPRDYAANGRGDASVSRKVRAVVGVALLLILSFAASCDQRGPKTIFDLIPSDSHIVMLIRCSDLSADQNLSRALDAPDLREELGKIGINAEDITRMTAFFPIRPGALIEAMTAPPGAAKQADEKFLREAGVIFEGGPFASFNEKMKSLGASQEEYSGALIWTYEGDSFSLLDPELLVGGQKAVVKSVVDVQEGQRLSLMNDPNREGARRLIATLDLEAPVGMLMIAPSDMQAIEAATVAGVQMMSAMLDAGPMGDLFGKIGFARGCSISLTSKGETIEMASAFLMKNEFAANIVVGAILLFKGFVAPIAQEQGSSPQAQAGVKFFQELRASVEGEMVLLTFAVDANLIAQPVKRGQG